MKNWIKRVVTVIVAAQVIYVILVNAALQLELTQTLINQIKPEKFHVAWEGAWTPYPFRVYATGISANGQARSQQWQFSTNSASASISVLPLIFKRVWLNGVTAENVDFRLRPRLKPDKDYSQFLEYYPPIEGKEVIAADLTPKKKKRAWHLSINNAELNGSHSFWIHQFKGTAEGRIEADFAFETRGGPMSIDDGEVDVVLNTLYVNESHEVFKRITLEGEIEFSPFVPKENKGIKMLRYLLADVEIDADVNHLNFIDLFTTKFNGLKVDGEGGIKGRLRYDQGEVLSGTDLSVLARDLRVEVLNHRISGDGKILVAVDPENENLMNLEIGFDNLKAAHEANDKALLTGKGLALSLRGDNQLFREQIELNDEGFMAIHIPDLSVPDLTLYERYIPEKWPFKLYGGTGRLTGTAKLSPLAFSMDLNLNSEKADMGIREFRFKTGLDAALKINNPDVASNSTVVSGTFIKLSDARLLKDNEESGEPWTASIEIKKGHLSLLGAEQKSSGDDVLDLMKTLEGAEVKDLLGSSSASFEIVGEMSELAWLNILFKESFRTSITGNGTITGLLNLASGFLGTGTDLAIKAGDLGVNVLDYFATGNGMIALKVEEGGETPDMYLQVDLTDASLKRNKESAAFFKDVNLQLSAHIEDVDFKKESKPFVLNLKIPSAHVTDMSVYNQFLPPDSPLKITGGIADLNVDIELKNEDADGSIKLVAKDLQALVDDQAISADFLADMKLVGGVPRDMMFDISGSRIVLDNVKVVGETQDFDKDSWAVTFELTEGHTVWRKPIKLDTKVEIYMNDSTPIVAAFANHREKHGWLGKILTVKDIKGKAELDMANNKIVIPYAYVSSDKIDIGAKGIIEQDNREGMLYARYRKLSALLKISEGKKNIDIIGPKRKFNEYQPTH